MTMIEDGLERLVVVAHAALNSLATVGGAARVLLDDWERLDVDRRELLLGLIVDGIEAQTRDMSTVLRSAMVPAGAPDRGWP